MFFLPFSLILFIAFILLFPFLFFMIQFGIIGAVSSKLGIPMSVGILIYFLSLLGSSINIPVKKELVEGGFRREENFERFLGFPKQMNCKVIAVNVGGCIIPVLLSIYLFHFVSPIKGLIGIAIITLFTYFLAKPVAGIGITIPAFIPPLICVILGLLLARDNPAPLAYVSGVLGTLIGADVLHLNEIARMGGCGVMSIGGAGVFDGIFLVGIIAVLLA